MLGGTTTKSLLHTKIHRLSQVLPHLWHTDTPLLDHSHFSQVQVLHYYRNMLDYPLINYAQNPHSCLTDENVRKVTKGYQHLLTDLPFITVHYGSNINKLP